MELQEIFQRENRDACGNTAPVSCAGNIANSGMPDMDTIPCISGISLNSRVRSTGLCKAGNIPNDMNRFPKPHRKNRLVRYFSQYLTCNPHSMSRENFICSAGYWCCRPADKRKQSPKKKRMVLKILKEDTILLQIRVIFSV